MSYWYLATPYSKYPDGLEAAFRLAADNAALLTRHGVPVFSPIVYSHPLAIAANIDPLDHEFWMAFDHHMMAPAKGLIMLTAPSWKESKGMTIELETFRAKRKPVVWMSPFRFPGKDVFRG